MDIIMEGKTADLEIIHNSFINSGDTPYLD